MVDDAVMTAIVQRWRLAHDRAVEERCDAIRERDDARVVADRLLRSLMTAARGDQPPPDGIDCDEVRTIATLRRKRDDQRDAIHEALAMVSAMRHERDEARAKLADWRNLARSMADLISAACPDASVWTDGLAVEYDRLVMAGPLPEPEEAP